MSATREAPDRRPASKGQDARVMLYSAADTLQIRVALAARIDTRALHRLRDVKEVAVVEYLSGDGARETLVLDSRWLRPMLEELGDVRDGVHLNTPNERWWWRAFPPERVILRVPG